jgi:hypothetical protein
MGWHCDYCGGHDGYSAQGFRTTCANGCDKRSDRLLDEGLRAYLKHLDAVDKANREAVQAMRDERCDS